MIDSIHEGIEVRLELIHKSITEKEGSKQEPS